MRWWMVLLLGCRREEHATPAQQEKAVVDSAVDAIAADARLGEDLERCLTALRGGLHPHGGYRKPPHPLSDEAQKPGADREKILAKCRAIAKTMDPSEWGPIKCPAGDPLCTP
jgi:hypothetical protein